MDASGVCYFVIRHASPLLVPRKTKRDPARLKLISPEPQRSWPLLVFDICQRTMGGQSPSGLATTLIVTFLRSIALCKDIVNQ